MLGRHNDAGARANDRDHRAVRAYGLGIVRPGGRGIRRLVDDGYLVRAPTVHALADALLVDEPRVIQAVAQTNCQLAVFLPW